MTLKEFDVKMNNYKQRLCVIHGDEWDELYDEISKFQKEYMENVLSDYEKTIDCEAKQHIYNLLSYAVRMSQSGSSIEHVKTKKVADEIDSIIWEEIGDYLLDYEIYKEKNHWAIDCMFAGNYVPYWDGWEHD